MNAHMVAEKGWIDPEDRRARRANNTANEADDTAAPREAGENHDQAGAGDASMAPADETGDDMAVEE